MQTSRALLSVDSAEAAEWYLDVLREHIGQLIEAADDGHQPLQDRQAALLMQFHILLGSFECAARKEREVNALS